MAKSERDLRREKLRQRQDEGAERAKGGPRKSVLDLAEARGATFYKPKEGKNRIDIIPHIVGTDHNPQKVKKGDPAVLVDYWVHGGVGPNNVQVLCLNRTYGKACPICEESRRLQDEGQKALAEKLYAKHRALYCVIDRATDNEDILLFDVSFSQFEKELNEAAKTHNDDGTMVYYADPVEGNVVKFRATTEKYLKFEYFKFKDFTFEERDEQYDFDEITKKAYSLDKLLIVPTYDDVKALFFGASDDDEKAPVADEDDDDEELGGATKCPHGHIFGTDVDEKKECKKCEVWEECTEARDIGDAI